MKRKYNILILFSCLLFYSSSIFSQATHCGAFYFESQMNSTDPNYSVRTAAFETNLQDSIIKNHYDSLFARKADVIFPVTRIAVVVHIIGDNASNAVSPTAITQAISDLNDIFRNTGTNANNTTVDTQIEFCLALKDEQGSSFTIAGVDITPDGTHGPYGPYAMTVQNDKDIKTITKVTPARWSPEKYLNIWICNLSSTEKVWGSGPTVYLPSSTEKYRDGVVCDAASFSAKLLAHGIGHWLNLRHTYGDDGSTCASGPTQSSPNTPLNTDYCSDTPWCTGSAVAWPCNTLTDQCQANNTAPNNNRLIQNYMDNSDEGCKNMFTSQQKNRMQALFSAGRTQLKTNSTAVCIVLPTCDDGITNGQETGQDCGGPTCPACPHCEQSNYFTINGRSTNWWDIVNVCNYYGAILLNPVNLSCPYNTYTWDYKIIGFNWNSTVSPAVNGEGPLSYALGHYAYLYISIQRCDMDKTPIGNESGTWFNISPYIQSDLNLHHYISYLSVPLSAGNYYRILVTNGFDTHIAYIKVFEPNVTLTNRTVTNPQVGDNIVLNGCTVSSPINVVATNKIDITGSSALTSGSYFINTITCGNTSAFRTANGNSNSKNYTDNYEQGNFLTSQKSSTTSAKLLDKSDLIVIKPNPNNGNFTIVNDENQGSLKSIEIQNSLGVTVQVISQPETSTEINIQNQSAGLYLVKLNYTDKVITKKVVKQ